ncbi:NUDIX domain-containing protein [Rhodococcus sp. HNM0569]|uniref:NUDIX hydrolase n=1 Tax=Rhodococcus sp. HNM0569 TaxID=2716340 RepID=UPI001469E45F|nr:NUDIX domain-containing protein [Rhodococcus sp. HNM0569]NLU82044.1 NUDIX domain-containing protein [Rhodococcus sp. HNM0569]
MTSTSGPADSRTAVAPVPKDASTVVLLRDGTDGLEVFLLRRVKEMAFAGGMTVFPGGGVDASDIDTEIGWAGPDASWWAERFATDERTAKALVCAAVRETFEECGVLLAGPTADSVVSDTARYTHERTRLEARELSFTDFLAREGLVLRSDLLRPWANWITPVGEKRRYDTRFFVAAAPDGQDADGATSEAEAVRWLGPQDALAQWRGGDTVLLPPTWAQLVSLTGYARVADVLAAEPEIPVILPVLENDPGTGVRVRFPDQQDYYAAGAHPWSPRLEDGGTAPASAQ